MRFLIQFSEQETYTSLQESSYNYHQHHRDTNQSPSQRFSTEQSVHQFALEAINQVKE